MASSSKPVTTPAPLTPLEEEDVDDTEFDFHVEFPSIGQSEYENIWPQSKTKDDSKTDDEKAVLVILLGWAGASDKYLKKYSDLYLQRGCIVLRYITPVKTLFAEPKKLSVIAHRILHLLKDLQLSSHPTFFHVFSNGGSFLYSNILREAAVEENYDFDFRGTIFDSAPAPRSFTSVFRAISNIYSHYPRLRWVIATAFVFFLVLQIFWYHLKLAVRTCFKVDDIEVLSASNRKSPKSNGHPLHNWLVRISRVKNYAFLFLYSDEDALIRSKEVEKVAQAVRENGNDVELVKFQGSEHVKHYRLHPEQYIGAVTAFIRKRMEGENEPIIFWDER